MGWSVAPRDRGKPAEAGRSGGHNGEATGVRSRDLVGRIERLEVRCRRCERHLRLGLFRLLDEHGRDLGLPELAVLLAADCPKAGSTNLTERCFVLFPQLLALETEPPAAGG